MTTPGQEGVGCGAAFTGTEWRADGPLREFLVRKFVRHQGYMPNLAAPITFNEKLLHKMLFDRRRILTVFADKLAVRDYVAERLGGARNLCTIHGVFSHADDLIGFDFPSRFVLKANHGSGWNHIHHGGEVDRTRLIQLSRRWLNWNYGRTNGEWCYHNIEPMVFVEEYLGDGYSLPVDYKFFCYSGVVRFIRASFDREFGLKINSYDRDWNVLDIRDDDKPQRLFAPPPANPTQMISIAERLSEGMDFIRVDLYDLGDRIVVGELTNYPWGLSLSFFPKEWDEIFGSYWRLPEYAGVGA